ncbi:hypothetical protein [Actinomadura flavalba]|uniref:hypothetical protein n=1 Tax=Actinomadura flavalba TaxID=1120938 RepID=UPI0003A48B80|nr:hypothetical protein [Actinomadura flavalba]
MDTAREAYGLQRERLEHVYRTMLNGRPSLRRLGRAAGVAPTTVSNWLRGTVVPQRADGLLRIVAAVAAEARAAGLADDPRVAPALDAARWTQVHDAVLHGRIAAATTAAEAARATAALAPDAPGRPLDDYRDPVEHLEVHAATPLDGADALPRYVPRDHDADLARIVAAARDGTSRLAVLVGGSSTGKTRACWEALAPLRGRGWRLWHPYAPTRPDALLDGLPAVAPRTVLWLNEAQHYLHTPQAAAELRTLLADPARGPVLVLGTLWPDHWRALTRPDDDAHEQARKLLTGYDIPVPDAFDVTADRARLRAAARGDPRWATALDRAEDGEIAQYLAGAPALLARHRNATPRARALLHAAMDAARIDHDAPSRAFLEHAAPGYLTAPERRRPDGFDAAFAELAEPVHGRTAPLAPGDGLRLADYLAQTGRRTRADALPPATFWTALENSGDVHALRSGAREAARLGLLRHAARLARRALPRDAHSGDVLLGVTAHVAPADPRPARWVAAHAPLDDVRYIAFLVGVGYPSSDPAAVAAFAARAARDCPLDDPGAVTELIKALWTATGPGERLAAALGRKRSHLSVHAWHDGEAMVTADIASDRRVRLHDIDPGPAIGALLARDPAARVRLDDLRGAADLLHELTKLRGAEAAAATLLRRLGTAPLTAAHALDVALLLMRARDAGSADPAGDLFGGRTPAPADDLFGAHVARLPVGDPAAAAGVVAALGAERGVAVAERAADVTALRDAAGVAELIGVLRAEHPGALARLLARRPERQVVVADVKGAAALLDALRDAAAHDAAAVFAERAAAQITVPGSGHEKLLDAFRRAGADAAIDVLLRRTAERADHRLVFEAAWRAPIAAALARHVPLDRSGVVARIVQILRAQGVDEHLPVLWARDVAATVGLGHAHGVADLLRQMRLSARDDLAAALAARLAAELPLDHPSDVTAALRALDADDADDAAVLLDREPAAHTDPRHSSEAAYLRGALRAAGRDDQAALLGARAAEHCSLREGPGVATLIDALADDPDARAVLLARDPAAHADVANADNAGRLIDVLAAAGDQAAARRLAERAARDATFYNDEDLGRLRDRCAALGVAAEILDAREPPPLPPHGREPDGTPSEPWGWDDLG